MSSQYPEGVIAQIARSLEARRLPTRLKPVWRERSFRPCVIVYRRNDFLSPQYLATVPPKTLCNAKLSSFLTIRKNLINAEYSSRILYQWNVFMLKLWTLKHCESICITTNVIQNYWNFYIMLIIRKIKKIKQAVMFYSNVKCTLKYFLV